jgi:hypothetical protein
MKLTLKRAVMVAAVLALCVLTVVAGNKNRIGTAGAQDLLIPVSARGIALGGSSVTLLSGADAIFYNPAGVARAADNVDAMFSTMNYIGDIGVSYVALTTHAGSLGSFGLSLKSLAFGDIPVTTEDFPDGTGETFKPTFVNLGLTYSNMLSDRISVGATVTMVTESFMSVSASGVTFNIGVQYSGLALPGLSLGVVVKNVGGQMKYDGANLLRQGTVNDAARNSNTNWYKVSVAAFDMPTTIDLGLSYQTKLNEKLSATVLGDFMNSNYAYDEYRLGAEFTYDKMFSVRGGYVIAPDAGTDAAGEDAFIYSYTLGAGVNLTLPGANVRVDYAYRAMKYFDANNVFTIALGF